MKKANFYKAVEKATGRTIQEIQETSINPSETYQNLETFPNAITHKQAEQALEKALAIT